MLKTRPTQVAAIVALISACMLVCGCAGNANLTKANFAKIKNGMDLKQVEAILGPGDKQSTGDGSNVAASVGIDVGGAAPAPRAVGEEYVWESGGKKISISFTNGKVTRFTSTGL